MTSKCTSLLAAALVLAMPVLAQEPGQPAAPPQTLPDPTDPPTGVDPTLPLLAPEPEVALVTGVDAAWLSQFAEDLGHKVLQASDQTGEAVVLVETESFLKFGLIGKACLGEQATKCKGLQIMTIFTPIAVPSDAEINEMNYVRAAVSIWKVPQEDGASGTTDVGVNRYLILDHGQSEENIALNVNVFIDTAEAIRDSLEQSGPSQPASTIDPAQ